MKQTEKKAYLVPAIQVVRIDNQSILCDSSDFDSANGSGEDMPFE